MWIKDELLFHEIGNRLWGGAKDRWDNATDEQREMALDGIESLFEITEDNPISITALNDMLWFSCDNIWFGDDDCLESE